MIFLRKRSQVRVLRDIDGGNGGGGDPAGGAGGGQDPNNGGNPNPAGGGGKDTAGTQEKDPAAQLRYQISRERDLRIAAEAKLKETMEKSKKQPPVFDADTDPDGTKQQEYIAEQKAAELFEKKMKELGLEDTLKKIQYEKEENEFFEVVKNESEKFKELGIEAPTKEQLKTILTTIDQKGITPEQIILLSQAQSIIQRLKPGGFTPGSGAKPKVETPKSQAEIREEIYKATGAFGRG